MGFGGFDQNALRGLDPVLRTQLDSVGEAVREIQRQIAAATEVAPPGSTQVRAIETPAQRLASSTVIDFRNVIMVDVDRPLSRYESGSLIWIRTAGANLILPRWEEGLWYDIHNYNGTGAGGSTVSTSGGDKVGNAGNESFGVPWAMTRSVYGVPDGRWMVYGSQIVVV